MVATMDVKEVLAEMLVENTGRSFLDSGGAYGRDWEQNQGKTLADWEAEPEATLWEVSVHEGELSALPTLSVFHFLANRLSEYDHRLQAYFDGWAKANDMYGLEAAQEFPAHRAERYGMEVQDLGDLVGSPEPITVNTYNGEDCLSQIVQWVAYVDPHSEAARVLLSIHGGCDARGGYTWPRVFTLSGDPQHDYEGICSLLDNARASLCCKECDATWDTDDAGYHWYPASGGGGSLESDWEWVDVAKTDAVPEGAVTCNSRTNYIECPECEDGALEVFASAAG